MSEFVTTKYKDGGIVHESNGTDVADPITVYKGTERIEVIIGDGELYLGDSLDDAIDIAESIVALLKGFKNE